MSIDYLKQSLSIVVLINLYKFDQVSNFKNIRPMKKKNSVWRVRERSSYSGDRKVRFKMYCLHDKQRGK